MLLMAPFLASADATIANVATPAICAGLGASGTAAQLVVGSYLVAYAVLLITGARLGQTHGYKRLFLLGVAVFAVTSLAAGMSPDVTVLVIMRFLQGAGAALMFPQALTGIQVNLAGERRSRAITLFAMALSGGAIFGQLLGGAIVSANIAGTTWRPIFLVDVPICLTVLAVAPRSFAGRRGAWHRSSRPARHRNPVTERPAHRRAPDPRPSPAVADLDLGGTRRRPACLRRLPRHPTTRHNRRSITVDQHLGAGRPAITLALLALLGSSATYFALLFTLGQYFQIGLGHSALSSGLVLVPWVVAFGIAGQITRRLPSSLGPMLPVGGLLLLSAAYLAISAALFAGPLPAPVLAALFAVGGLGWGTAFTALIGHLTGAVTVSTLPTSAG